MPESAAPANARQALLLPAGTTLATAVDLAPVFPELFGKRGNNPFCHHRALELLETGRRERIVRVEAPPGEPFDQGRFELIEEAWPDDELVSTRARVRATSPG